MFWSVRGLLELEHVHGKFVDSRGTLAILDAMVAAPTLSIGLLATMIPARKGLMAVALGLVPPSLLVLAECKELLVIDADFESLVNRSLSMCL